MTKGEESRGLTPSDDVPGHRTTSGKPGAGESPPSEGGALRGRAGVAGALQGISFPADKEDLMERAGTSPVEFRAGQFMSLGELLLQNSGRAFLLRRGSGGCHSRTSSRKVNDRPDVPEEEAMAEKSMTVREAGRKGGQKTASTHGHEFYEEIGQKGGAKGGERLRQLVQRGRESDS